VASRGVEIARADPRPPTDPILNQPWLEKRLPPGATWNMVLSDSAADLTQVAAMPLALGVMTLENTLRSTVGQQAARSLWDVLSSAMDTVTRHSGDAGATHDRSEQRALLLMLGMTPLWTALGDGLQLAEGLSRAALGDVRVLRSAVASALHRIEASAGPAAAAAATPSRLLAALDGPGASDPARAGAIGLAMLEDGATLARMALAYADLLTRLSARSMQTLISGTLDVDQIDTWVRADEVSRAKTGEGLPEAPASVRQLEDLVASYSGGDAPALGRGFFASSTIDLARDTIFAYSTRAIGRAAALARMTRLFGADESERLRDDCSLRTEILDAGSDRDRRIAALVTSLRLEDGARLREARNHTARRLDSLTTNSPDAMLERFAPLRIGERVAILRRFVGIADTANALDGDPSGESARQRVLSRFNEWLAEPPASGDPTS